tara:strand:- start:738 stop:1013 length:276 start_codon:yes stop_codon:yes gene_type:complete
VSRLVFIIDSPEDLGAPLEFLYYLYILSNAGGKVMPPPVRFAASLYPTADWLAKNAEEIDRARGPRRFSGAMTTPEILAYENSALGSTRII